MIYTDSYRSVAAVAASGREQAEASRLTGVRVCTREKKLSLAMESTHNKVSETFKKDSNVVLL
jgi:hypothetical protein